MTSLITPAQARLRGINLPADDGAAQDIIDEQEAWLASKIGPLTGVREETFYVAQSFTRGKLGLRRSTDDVDVTDGGSAVDASDFRLIDDGSAIVLTGLVSAPWWRGPLVTATYTPSDETRVRSAVYALCALSAQPEDGLQMEVIGDYTRMKNPVFPGEQRRAIIASDLLPKRDMLVTLSPPYIFAMEGITRIA